MPVGCFGTKPASVNGSQTKNEKKKAQSIYYYYEDYYVRYEVMERTAAAQSTSFLLSFFLSLSIIWWYYDFRYETIDCKDQRENDQIKYRKISRRVLSTMVGVFVKILRNTLWVQVITALFLFVSYLSFFLSPFSPFIFISFVNRHCGLFFYIFFYLWKRRKKIPHDNVQSIMLQTAAGWR